MDDKERDALKFAVKEKVEMSLMLMNQYRDNNEIKYNFCYGQYLAYNEIFTMLNNVQS